MNANTREENKKKAERNHPQITRITQIRKEEIHMDLQDGQDKKRREPRMDANERE